MGESISMWQLMAILKKRVWLIIAITIVTSTAAATISIYAITPQYEAKTQLLVNQQADDQERLWYQMETDLQLIRTYNVIMTSSTILQQVISELGLNESSEQLAKKITIEHENDSKVININVLADSEKQAVHVANTLANVVQTQIPKLMNVDNINVLSRATVAKNPSPVSPNIPVNTIIGAAIGIVISVSLAYVIEIFDRTIKDEQQMEQLLHIPVMGVISSIPVEKMKKRKPYRMRGDEHIGVEK